MSRRMISVLKILALLGAFLSGVIALAQCTDTTAWNLLNDARADAQLDNAGSNRHVGHDDSIESFAPRQSTITVRVITPDGRVLRNLVLIGPDGEVCLDQQGVAIVPAYWKSIRILDPRTNRVFPPLPVAPAPQGPTVLVVSLHDPANEFQPFVQYPTGALLNSLLDTND